VEGLTEEGLEGGTDEEGECIGGESALEGRGGREGGREGRRM